jgi:hypothetical protein
MSVLDNDKERKEVGLPSRIFLFTLDQVSSMLNVDEAKLRREYLYYAGRSVGRQPLRTMFAANIAPKELPAEWRVSDREFIRYCKAAGFRGYDLTRASA